VLGLAARVKPGGSTALTERVTPEVCFKAPLVPVIVRVEEPTGVVPLVVVTVSVELPDPATVAGEKVPTAPAGSPLTLSVTAPLNPPTAAMLVV
jgi:hypothetical protein